MKTTKEEQSLIRMALNNLQGQSQEDFIISVLEKRFSVSDVEQLQEKLIKEGILFGLSEQSCKNNPDLLISRKKFDEIFNNFKGK